MSPRGRGANGELGHVLPLRNLLAGGKAAGGGLALPPPGGAWAKHGVTALYVGGWMAASSLLILLNKVILTDYGFPYPITLSGMGMLFSCLMSQIVVRGLGVESPKPEVDWEFWIKKILPIGFLAAMALTFGNMAYLSLSVSFIQMLKSFTPVMTLVLSLLAGLEQRNNYLFLSVTVICLGMMVAAFGEIAFTVTGFTHMMLSQSSEASKLVASQVLLSKLKFSKWQVMYHVMPAIVLVMALLGAVLEFPAIVRGAGAATLRQRPLEFFLASTLGFCINFLTLGIIDRLSSLWFKLLGQLKNVGVVYLSVLLFGSTVTATQSLGYVIAIGGFLCYSHVKAEAGKAAAARKERSALDGGRGEEGKPTSPRGGLKGAQP